MKEEEIELTIEDNTLTLSGEKKLDTEPRVEIVDMDRRAPPRCEESRHLQLTAAASDPGGTDHVTNMPHHLLLRCITECSAVHKSIGNTPWSCPSTHHLGRVPVSHVDMEVLIAGDLEKHDFAVVLQMPVGFEAPNGRFQGLNLRRPGIAEKSVSDRDRRRASAAAVLRGDTRRTVRTVSEA